MCLIYKCNEVARTQKQISARVGRHVCLHAGPRSPKLLVNFPINLRCYILLGCWVKNVILACLKKNNIDDSAFFDIAALVRQSGGLRWLHCHMTTAYSSGYTGLPNQNPGYETACGGCFSRDVDHYGSRLSNQESEIWNPFICES